MEEIKSTIKKIVKKYPAIFQAILLLKKNKLFSKVRIKKTEGDLIVLSTKDYLTFNTLNSNKEKVIEYINDIFSQVKLDTKIQRIKIINNPEPISSTKTKTNQELINKIKQIKEKIYGHKRTYS
ncbi:MAG: hypothetical protein RMJ51_00780 [Candidatus Calescibacterium sp.]|nr:hypothetical protein [Candidatus Calescibacterium sp.]MCX7972636.1 hypothetical protein [bacterium]MDW8194767.1 hypothetical protein [Candidatus Calescibacterium sp.]